MNDQEKQERERVVAESRSWLRTPYHHCASVKGHGVDCAMLLKRVFEDTGLVSPVDFEPYSPQWGLHRDAELYMDCVRRYAREITQDQAQPGDIALWRMGRTFSHGAIIVTPGWPSIIVADANAGCVTLAMGTDGRLADAKKHPCKFFTLKRW